MSISQPYYNVLVDTYLGTVDSGLGRVTVGAKTAMQFLSLDAAIFLSLYSYLSSITQSRATHVALRS